MRTFSSFLAVICAGQAAAWDIHGRNDYVTCLTNAVGGNASAVVLPTEANYAQELDIYNLDHPFTPAAIVFPSSAKEVAALVRCACGAGLAVQPLSGGHNYLNFGLGGQNGSLSIHVQKLNHISYHAAEQTLTFGTGNLLGTIRGYLESINRNATFSWVPSLGTGGHFTIGGLGPLSRTYGLALDQIVSAEVVLADGRIVTASDHENQDIFFAIRGAGWSFGIVTEFTIKTHKPLQRTTWYQYLVPGNWSNSADVVQGWLDLVSQKNLSRGLTTTAYIYEGFVIIAGEFSGPPAEWAHIEKESIKSFATAGITFPPENALELYDVLDVLDKLNLTATFSLVNDLRTSGLLDILPKLPGSIWQTLIPQILKLIPAIEAGDYTSVEKGLAESSIISFPSFFNVSTLQAVLTDLRYSGLFKIISTPKDVQILAEVLPYLNLTNIFELVTEAEQSPLLSQLPPGIKLSQVFTTLFSAHTPAHFYSKNLKFTEFELPRIDTMDAIFQYLNVTQKGSALWFVLFDLAGGAINDVSQDTSAYWHRDALVWLQSFVVDLSEGNVRDDSKAFLNGLNKLVQGKLSGVDESAYPGYCDDELKDPLKAYWGGNVPKLRKIKQQYDPENLFRNPQSIQP